MDTSWTGAASELISPSPSGLTPQLLGSILEGVINRGPQAPALVVTWAAVAVDIAAAAGGGRTPGLVRDPEKDHLDIRRTVNQWRGTSLNL